VAPRGRPVIGADLDLNRCQHVGRLEQQVTRVVRVSGFTAWNPPPLKQFDFDMTQSRVGDQRAESVEPDAVADRNKIVSDQPEPVETGIGDGGDPFGDGHRAGSRAAHW
jgi:hypothetical protein